MAPLSLLLPLAELEVGKHLYWKIGGLVIHGQVFISSWVVIGALLALVVAGTRKLERDPRGVQNLLEFLWAYVRDLAREQIGEKAYRDWLPFIGTLFLFIFVSNWGRCSGSLEVDPSSERRAWCPHGRHQHNHCPGTACFTCLFLCRSEPQRIPVLRVLRGTHSDHASFQDR